MVATGCLPRAPRSVAGSQQSAAASAWNRHLVAQQGTTMSSRQLALVADNPRLAHTIQDRLRTTLDHPPLLLPFDAIQEHLEPHFDGLLVCATTSDAHRGRIIDMVRGIRLRQWPSTVLLVEAEGGASNQDLTCLDPYVACRVRWPEEAPTLLGLIHFHSLTHQPRLTGSTCAPVFGVGGELAGVLAKELQRQTPALVSLAEPLAMAAAHDVTVLLTGETGSGKTHLARLIHEHSPRKNRRLLVVPCGALSPSLVESEFFGHARGAFTGADQAKVGKFEAVGEGTLLLDEIDTLGLEQQAKLLRVIETGEYEPVGSNETRQCRGRIIAASNLNLEEEVARGKFRQDLYYRLNVLTFYLPPLRERVQDISCLARGMAARFSERFHKELFGISAEAQALLEAFAWAGNIRQLENVMQQAVLMSTGPELLPQHLPSLVRERAAFAAVTRARSVVVESRAAPGLVEDRDQHERNIIERALAEAGNCRTQAARALQVSRVTLYNKMKKYGIPLRMASLSSGALCRERGTADGADGHAAAVAVPVSA
jgi:two-component system, NtrC family, response regulator HydG